MIRQQIMVDLQKTLEKLGISGVEPNLEHPKEEKNGDYSTNIAMILTGKQKDQKGNFLENIEWFLKTIKKDNYQNYQEPVVVGRFSEEVRKKIKAKNSLIYLKPKVYAKVNGWLQGHSGHLEIKKNYWYLLPLFLYRPSKLLRDKRSESVFHFVIDLEGSLDIVVDLLYWGEDYAQVSSMYFVRDAYLKNFEEIVLDGGTAVPSYLSGPLLGGLGAGSRLSSLHQNQIFYNKLDKKSQGEILFYQEKPTPFDLAQKIAAELEKNKHLGKLVEKVEAVSPGFINFWLSKDYLSKIMLILSKMSRSADLLVLMNDRSQKPVNGQKIMVEFAHPNTHKMFHIGHLRNITTGESIVRLLEANGAKVIRANYQGDLGLHIAKALYGLNATALHNTVAKAREEGLDEKMKLLGEAYAAGAKAYEENEQAQKEIRDLNFLIYAAAQRFNQERGVEPGSTDYLKFVEGRKTDINEVYELWKKTRAWSLEYFDKIYQRLGTTFDRFYFESECLAGVDLANLASQEQVLQKSDGAIIFNGKAYGLDTRVFVNSLGLPTYEGKELVLARMEFFEFGKLDRVIHVVGPEQASFFKVTFKVEELLDAERYKNKQFHLVYGWVKLKHGKMSSRLGQVVLAEWLLDEVKKKLKDSYKMKDETVEIVAVAAVKYSMLKVNVTQEIAFDIDESINLHGDSGPYLQYTYARCQSVLRKAKETIDDGKWKIGVEDRVSKIESKNLSSILNSQPLFSIRLPSVVSNLEPKELSLLRTLYKFPEVVADAGIKYSPNLLCGYLFDLAGKFNLFYNQCSILKSEIEVKHFRLLLTRATAQILKNGLDLLGIKTVEKM